MTRKFGFSAMLDSVEILELSEMISKEFGGEVSKLKPKELQLRIITTFELKTTEHSFCNSITPLAARQMIEQKIDPFDWKFGENQLMNLFLYNKKLSISSTERKNKDLRKRILQMGGEITDILPDYRISERKENTSIAPVISAKWIDALYNQKHYVEPSSFAYEALKKPKTIRKTKTSPGKKKDLGKSMKTPRKKMEQMQNGTPEKIQEIERTQSITNFFPLSSQQISKKKEPSIDIPKPDDIFEIKSPAKHEIIEDSPPHFISSKRTPVFEDDSSSASDFDNDDNLIKNVDELIKKYSSESYVQDVLQKTPEKTYSSSQTLKRSLFDESSESDSDEIEIYARKKITPHHSSTSSQRSQNSQTIVSHFNEESDSPIVCCNDDSPIILKSPKHKSRSSSQQSPKLKIPDPTSFCSSLCQQILSTKKAVASPNRSPLFKRPSIDEFTHFTQLSQLSQRDNTNDDDVYYCSHHF